MIPEHTYRPPANGDDRFRAIVWRIILAVLAAFWAAIAWLVLR